MVHPTAKILAEGGPIEIGEGNLIMEMVTIINRSVCTFGRPVAHCIVILKTMGMTLVIIGINSLFLTNKFRSQIFAQQNLHLPQNFYM